MRQYKPVSAEVRSKLALLLRRRIGSQREDKDFDSILRQKNLHIFAFSMLGLACMMLAAVGTWFASAISIERCERPPSNPVVSFDRQICANLLAGRCGCSVRLEDGNGTMRDACYIAVPYDSYFDDPEVSNTLLNVMYLAQAVITTTTMVSMALIVQKYRLKLLSKRAEWSGANLFEVEGFRGDAVVDTQQQQLFYDSYSFWGSTLKYYCIAELIIHAPHPILWMAIKPEGNYSDEQIPNLGFKILQVLMFLRLYLIPNMLHIFSNAYINRFEVVSSQKELSDVGYQIRAPLTLKMFFYNNTALSLVSMALISIFIFGYSIFSLERVEQWTGGSLDGTDAQVCDIYKNFGTSENAFWWAYVTFSTVGYGEFVPISTFGRLTSAACAVVGITSFIVFSAILVDRISLTKEQKHGVEFLETKAADKKYRDAASFLIKTAYTIHMRPRILKKVQAKAAGPGGDKDKAAAVTVSSTPTHKANRMHYAIKHFRTARRQLEGAFMKAEDVVIHQKMKALQDMSTSISREVMNQVKDFEDVERHLEQRLRSILNTAAKYRRMGNVAV